MATNPIKPEREIDPANPLESEFWGISPNISPKARAVLEKALATRHSRPFNEVLAEMPDVGLDSDFDFRNKG
jgi:hypothetical protein